MTKLTVDVFLGLLSVNYNAIWWIKVQFYLSHLVAPGDVVSVTGIVKIGDTGEGKGNKNKASSMFVLYIDANSLVKASTNPTEDGADTAFTKDYVQFSEKDLSGIRKIAEYGGSNIFRLLVNSLCPPIFGHTLVKAGLVLGLLGGRRRVGQSEKEITIRGDPHILVVSFL